MAQVEFLLVAAALAEGWVVSVPDHEGLDGRWGAPYEPGHRVLDGIRAALGCQRLGLTASTPVGLWGYSGGGLATAWAAEISADYAPELNVVGAVLGSPVGDPGNAFRRLNGSLMSGLAGLMVASLVQIYPELDRVIQRHVSDKGRSLLAGLQHMTTLGGVLWWAHTDMENYVDRPLDEVLDSPVRYVFNDIKLGASTPTPPVLVVQAVHDSVIAVDDIDALVEIYLAGGAEVVPKLHMTQEVSMLRREERAHHTSCNGYRRGTSVDYMPWITRAGRMEDARCQRRVGERGLTPLPRTGVDVAIRKRLEQRESRPATHWPL